MHNVGTLLNQSTVVLLVVNTNIVQSWQFEHSNVSGDFQMHVNHRRSYATSYYLQVCVAKPLHSFVSIADSPQNNLRVQIVCQLSHKLRLNGQLLVHQAEVILQLRVVRDDDTLTIGVILRPTRASKHL